MVIERSDRAGKQRIVAEYMVDNLNTHNIWTIKIFITEILYFMNILGNIYFMDYFLGNFFLSTVNHHSMVGGEFRTYGLEVATITELDPEQRVDPMAHIFPRVTKCTFNKVGYWLETENHKIFVVNRNTTHQNKVCFSSARAADSKEETQCVFCR